MSRDFILIQGLGIFPTASILDVRPAIEESFTVQVVNPETSAGGFTFVLSKITEIGLVIRRSTNTKEKEETLNDNSYTELLREDFSLDEAEFMKLLYQDTPDKKIAHNIERFKSRLRKMESFRQRLAILNSNPEAPDYQSNLASVMADQPSKETLDKQQKSIDTIVSRAKERLDEIVEADNVNAEAVESNDEEHPVIALFETDEHRDDINERINKVLKSFYSKNMNDGDDIGDYFEEVEDDKDEIAFHNAGSFASNFGVSPDPKDAIEEAEVIRTNPGTIRNAVDMAEENFENFRDAAREATSPQSEI